MKKVALLIPEGANIAPLENARHGFLVANDYQQQRGGKPCFDVQLVAATPRAGAPSISSSTGVGEANNHSPCLPGTRRIPMTRCARLETSRKTVAEVMYDVGYNDTKAFRDTFVRYSGMSPVTYREQYL